jgi:5-methylcytosine-specific restriction endonuclease McrA
VKPEAAIQFLRQFQELLAEGGFVATYKFALLQALADLSVEQQPATDGSLRLHMEQVAEKFIEYYWKQAKPFRDEVLRQNTKGQAEIVSLISAYRMQTDGRLAGLRIREKDWRHLRKRVAGVVVKMPLWKLQHIGNQPNEFLYQRSEYRDRSIRLLPGIPEAFRAFHPLLTSMIRGGWITQIHRIKSNRDLLGPSAELEEFLFGTDRKSLDRYRDLLHAHQAGECFYCGKKVTGKGDLDHFIPWSRYPLDLGHNFVFAHSACNNAKRDYLAAPPHIERWRVQNLDEGDSLGKLFSEASLLHDLERSELIARWAYQQGQDSKAQLWVRRGEFEECDHQWQAALSATDGRRLTGVENSPKHR